MVNTAEEIENRHLTTEISILLQPSPPPPSTRSHKQWNPSLSLLPRKKFNKRPLNQTHLSRSEYLTNQTSILQINQTSQTELTSPTPITPRQPNQYLPTHSNIPHAKQAFRTANNISATNPANVSWIKSKHLKHQTNILQSEQTNLKANIGQKILQSKQQQKKQTNKNSTSLKARKHPPNTHSQAEPTSPKPKRKKKKTYPKPKNVSQFKKTFVKAKKNIPHFNQKKNPDEHLRKYHPIQSEDAFAVKRQNRGHNSTLQHITSSIWLYLRYSCNTTTTTTTIKQQRSPSKLTINLKPLLTSALNVNSMMLSVYWLNCNTTHCTTMYFSGLLWIKLTTQLQAAQSMIRGVSCQPSVN